MTTDILTTEELLHETSDAVAKEESLKGGASLTPDLLRRMNAYWRAANYVSVGQIYLYDNPLSRAASPDERLLAGSQLRFGRSNLPL